MTDEIANELGQEPFDTELQSPRLRFYLAHKSEIDIWAALKREVRDATGELLLGLRDDLEGRFAGSSDFPAIADVLIRSDGEGTRWPRLTLYRGSWQGERGVVLAGVAIEWSEKVDPGGSDRPWVGIRVERGTGFGTQLMETLRASVERAGVLGLEVQRRNRYWPALSLVDRDPDWWKDIVGWRQRVIERYIETWHLSSPLIDQAMTQVRVPDFETTAPDPS